MREKDYDAALASKDEIRIKLGGVSYEYRAEAPIDVAIEWMSRQTGGAAKLGEEPGVFMLQNYRVVFGADRFEEMRKNSVGAKTADDAYRDLLDWWGLWERPKDGEPDDVDILVNRIETITALAVDDEQKLIEIAALMSALREWIEEYKPDAVDEDIEVEETAGNPA